MCTRLKLFFFCTPALTEVSCLVRNGIVFFFFFGWPIKTVPCVLNRVLHWPPKASLLTVVVDEVYVLVSQTKAKTLLKQHFWGEQPIKTLNTVNDLKLLSSDRKLYPKLSALLCFPIQEQLIECIINISYSDLQKWKLARTHFKMIRILWLISFMIVQIVMPFTSVYWHRKFPVESSGVIWLADLMHLFQSSGCISMLGI